MSPSQYDEQSLLAHLRPPLPPLPALPPVATPALPPAPPDASDASGSPPAEPELPAVPADPPTDPALPSVPESCDMPPDELGSGFDSSEPHAETTVMARARLPSVVKPNRTTASLPKSSYAQSSQNLLGREQT